MERRESQLFHAARLRPVVAAALFALGLILGREASAAPAHLWFALAGAGAVCALFLRGRAARIALCAAAVGIGAGWFSLRIYAIADNPIHAALAQHSAPLVRVEGVVLEDPRTAERGRGVFAAYTFAPATDRFRMRITGVIAPGAPASPVRTNALVSVRAPLEHIRAGDRVRLSARAAAIDPPSNPGAFHADLWAAQERISARLFVPDPALVERIDAPDAPLAAPAGAVRRAVATLRARVAAPFLADDTEARALMAAIVVGEDPGLLRDARQAFTRLGVGHLLAISGLHLGVLAWVALLALRAATGGSRWDAPLVALLVITYILIVPAKAPIARAAIMTLGFLAAESSGRRYDRLAVLAWTGVLVLLWRPLELWSAGFQLSFVVVGALIALTGPLRTSWFGAPPTGAEVTPRGWLWRRTLDMTAASVVAWLVAAPIVMHHFAMFSPLAVPATVALTPVFTLTLALGHVTMLVAIVAPALAQFLAPAIDHLAAAQLAAVHAVDALPGVALRTPPVPALWALLVGALVWWWIGAPRALVRWRAACAVLAGAWLGWVCIDAARAGLPRGVAARIDALDVGDGTCFIIRAPGAAILWDAGAASITLGEREVPGAARALGLWRAPAAVVTHPDLDHYAMLPDLAEPLGIRTLYVGEMLVREGADNPRSGVRRLVDEMQRRGIEIRVIAAGDAIHLSPNVTLRVLSPEPGAQWSASNDASLVAMLEVRTRAGLRTALLTGDAEDSAIRALRAARPELYADVMEVPHHGSARPVAIAFVRHINPPVAIQSTGPQRQGDERWDEARQGRLWLCTADHGAVGVEFRNDGAIRAGPLSHRGRIIDMGGTP